MIGAIILQIVLIFLNAVFASAEIAVISTNEAKLEKLSADELGLREMLSRNGVTKARKAALEHLRSCYPGSSLHLWRDVYHALKDI